MFRNLRSMTCNREYACKREQQALRKPFLAEVGRLLQYYLKYNLKPKSIAKCRNSDKIEQSKEKIEKVFLLHKFEFFKVWKSNNNKTTFSTNL